MARRLNAVRDDLDEETPEQFTLDTPKRLTRSLTPTERETMESLPKKVRPKYESMVRRGFARRVAKALAAGTNPFRRQGARYLEVACGRLLAGGFTKPELKMAFQKQFGWTEGTARSHVSVCVKLLPAIGAATVEGNRLVFRPKVQAQANTYR